MQSTVTIIFWLLVPVAALLFAFCVIREGTKEGPPAAPQGPEHPAPPAAQPVRRMDDEAGVPKRQRAA